MPPKIERKQLADITVSAGEMLKFEGNVIGEPPAGMYCVPWLIPGFRLLKEKVTKNSSLVLGSPLFVFSIVGPKQKAGSLLKHVSGTVFMLFHMVPICFPW